MTIRLRRAPPRRRNRTRAAPAYGFAALVVIGVIAFVVFGRHDDLPPVQIERLPPTAAPVVVASATGATIALPRELVSLPPLAPPRPLLTEHRIVSFYGNPLAEVLGVLGAQEPEETVTRLRAQADAYRSISDDRTIIPAFHFIYAVAQSHPGDDDTYLLRMDEALVDRWVKVARDNGILIFLDIQMGRSTVEAELPRIYKWLAEEHVHVGIDTEFAWGKDGIPNDDIGYMTGEQLNRAQALLQKFTMEQRLPTKVLVVHQFLPGMVKNKAALQAYDRVEIVFDADGFGSPQLKLAAWGRVILDGATPRAGIKLFYKHDINLMSPADVLNLEPRPLVIIYQ